MSTFKQKKVKTLATRKKTRKRKAQAGMTHEDESGRLFQPPSQRDPRWKKPDVSAVINGVLRAKKKQRMSLLGEEDDEDDDDDDEPEMVDPIESEDEVEEPKAKKEDDEEEEQEPLEVEEEEDDTVEDDSSPKPPAKLVASLEDAIAAAAKIHATIRRKDTRKKAKILMLVDTPSLFKGLKKALNIKAESLRARSRLGVRSGGEKKVEATYKNIGPLKTPMEKFKESNEDVLKAFKIGKIVTLVAEDTSFYPYSDMAFDHLILVAKAAQTAVNFNRVYLHDMELHTLVISEKLSAEDRNQLTERFVVTQ